MLLLACQRDHIDEIPNGGHVTELFPRRIKSSSLNSNALLETG